MIPEKGSPLTVDFLRDIYYVQVRLEFEVEQEVALPPFAGSALRGVLGHALREHLCALRSGCAQQCAQPDTCEYFRLFERSRDSSDGNNLPKSLILDPPVLWVMEQISLGAPCELPYEIDGANAAGLPRIVNHHPWRAPAGGEFSARLTLLGQTEALLPSLIRVLQLARLRIGNGSFCLRRVVDTAFGGRTLWDRSEGFPIQQAMRQDLGALLRESGRSRSMVIAFITPVRLRTGAGNYCFSAAELAQHFWEAALVRAMRARDTFCKPGQRLPWMALPLLPRLQACRFYHYVLPRLSLRQRAFMDFDGIIGNATYENVPGELAALARAAEILHIGQKATFGLGRIRCLVLE